MPANLITPRGGTPNPVDSNTKVWRYMDLAKLISILSNNTIYFPRADTFQDCYETVVPKGIREDRVQSGKGYISAVEFAKYASHWINVSCWHINDFESAAMWKLYTKSNESIAIRSSFQNLINAFPNNVNALVVKYIDYDNPSFHWLHGEHHHSQTIAYKRSSFEYEKELRFITVAEWPLNEDSGFNLEKKNHQYGVDIPIIVENVIEEILVSPEADPWITEVVKVVVEKFGFGTIQVTKSTMYELPE